MHIIAVIDSSIGDTNMKVYKRAFIYIRLNYRVIKQNRRKQFIKNTALYPVLSIYLFHACFFTTTLCMNGFSVSVIKYIKYVTLSLLVQDT